MRTTPFFIIVFAVLVAAGIFTFRPSTAGYTSISEQNENPLTASRYGDELADSMANYIIAKHPITEDADTVRLLQKEIERGKDIADAARETQSRGLMGNILQMQQETYGFALYVDNTLYLSSDFQTTPGPSLHAYLTEVVDPRDTEFPDATSVDLGVIQAAYGPQRYEVPERENPEALRTFVLYDTKLKQIYAFAQLSRTAN